MISIFHHQSYKAFVNEWVSNQPSRGRGTFQKFAKNLRVHPTLISQVFRGPKDLTLEQAASLARYIALGGLETEYFLALVQRARAGTEELRAILDDQIGSLLQRASDLVNRVRTDGKITAEVRQTFYSNWHYSAVRLATSLDELSTPNKISRYLGLPLGVVESTLGFLTMHGLCVSDGAKYSLGPAITHLESSSELLPRHHSNWRVKAQTRHSFLGQRELAFSAPLSISRKNADLFREKLLTLVKELGDSVKGSEAEEIRCLNLDWFLLGPD